VLEGRSPQSTGAARGALLALTLVLAGTSRARADDGPGAVGPDSPDLAGEGLLEEGSTATPALPPVEPQALSPLPERSYVVPIAETVIFNLGLWAADRYAFNDPFSRVTFRSIGANLKGGWWYDSDDFNTNEMLHPYSGSVFHNAARSAGWNFWGAFLLDFAGSLWWKIGGENGPPSTNDQITTTLAGAFLGESLFRTSRMVLDRQNDPGVVRWVGSALISPAATVNAVVLRDKIADPDPPVQSYEGRFSVGVTGGTAETRTGYARAQPSGLLSARLVHGLPGELEPEIPFDHFVLELDFSSTTLAPWNELTSLSGPTWFLTTRGLILAGSAGLGEDGAMLYGLFGTYDFGGPTLLRVTESGLGPGVVLSVHPSRTTELDATLLASATFGSGGAYVPPTIDRDYRFGYGGLLLADGSLWMANRVELALTGRAYLIPEAIEGGNEGLLIGKAALRIRVGGPHALGVEGTFTRRWANYSISTYGEHADFTAVTYSYLFSGS